MSYFTRAMLIANGTITPVFQHSEGRDLSVTKVYQRLIGSIKADPVAVAKRRMDAMTKTDKALSILRKAGAL